MSPALARIFRDLDRHERVFDLDRDDLADKLHAIAVDTIARDMEDEVDPDGVAWEPLSPAYAKAKEREFPGRPISVRYQVMKSVDQLWGEDRITPREAVYVYGVDQAARDEATWFQEGNANQPARRFYALSAEARQRIDEFLRRWLASALR